MIKTFRIASRMPQNSRKYLLTGVTLACLPVASTALAQTITFYYTGSAQTLDISSTGGLPNHPDRRPRRQRR
jgi:hypothetical protein